jgi:hypothetical protein
LPDDDSRQGGEHLQPEGLRVRAAKLSPAMTQTKFTIAALVVGFTIAALIVLSAITMGAVAGT